ncbi:TetR/AcrR family transcriptional regulator [Frankia sp. AiPs1]|uniref:TetR/AcrR family transcriptional regulator n=1 Tax=Frankia sp. AiPs1 TaxID=573493 RepID=UPI002043DCA3|nr:TetR/AcrR family transcriptional regulator [Frankia sp. AiPs1]MCM3921165.1 TetR/AcrR family transcriptional regulator [Frankia sp. AiPs1]
MPDSSPPPRRSAAETREHVLAVAHELFYWQGIRATGVDTLAARAGVAPTTLYRLFAAKDDLVAAYVERAGALYRQWFTDAAQAGGTSPRARILAVFDALVDQTRPDRCRGCPFLMALAEIPDPQAPAHRHAVAAKAWVRDQFAAMTAALAAPGTHATPADADPTTHGADPATHGADPASGSRELADRLVLIMEGVYASVAALGADGPAQHARDLVRFLLDSHGGRR